LSSRCGDITAWWYFYALRPNPASWFIFTVLEAVWAAGMGGAGENFLLNATSSVGAALIFVRSFRQGAWTWKLSDELAVGAGLTAIAVAIIARDCHVTIIACICANTIAMLPTAIKTYLRPQEECAVVWSLWLLGSVAYLYLQWGDWRFDSIATPIVIFAEEALMVVLILWRTRTLNAKHTVPA
jgi:hypothetical protein